MVFMKPLTQDQRAKVLLALQSNPHGLSLDALNRKLGWRKNYTTTVLNDLHRSDMAFADYVTEWESHRRHSTSIEIDNTAWLHEISAKGQEFLEHWQKLKGLTSTPQAVPNRYYY
jgi:hypothetical protein